MLGYDNPEATAEALKMHKDGNVWLHMGDIGYMNEDGVVFVLTRGHSERFGGGRLIALTMENKVMDAGIKGIKDEFFVIIPDYKHKGYYLPYLYVVLEDGYTVKDIEKSVKDVLESYEQPVQIISIPKRPFFHFKTNRIGLTKELQKMALN